MTGCSDFRKFSAAWSCILTTWFKMFDKNLPVGFFLGERASSTSVEIIGLTLITDDIVFSGVCFFATSSSKLSSKEEFPSLSSSPSLSSESLSRSSMCDCPSVMVDGWLWYGMLNLS